MSEEAQAATAQANWNAPNKPPRLPYVPPAAAVIIERLVGNIPDYAPFAPLMRANLLTDLQNIAHFAYLEGQRCGIEAAGNRVDRVFAKCLEVQP